MKRKDAILCLDCDEIHDNQNACPKCLSGASGFSIARVIKPMEEAIEYAKPANENRECLRCGGIRDPNNLLCTILFNGDIVKCIYKEE